MGISEKYLEATHLGSLDMCYESYYSFISEVMVIFTIMKKKIALLKELIDSPLNCRFKVKVSDI